MAILRSRDRGIDIEVDYSFKPFQLDPTAPTDGITPVIEGYAKKFGGHERATEILQHVTSVAAAENIQFNMDIALRANTFDAHRLLAYASHNYGYAVQISLKERLMDAYFTNGLNIADLDVLAGCASSVGIDHDECVRFLRSNEFATQVRTEIASASELGVTAVPTFVINGQWSVPGAQDVEMFERTLERMHAQA